MRDDLTGLAFTGAWIDYFESLDVEGERELARTLNVSVAKGGEGAERALIEGRPHIAVAEEEGPP